MQEYDSLSHGGAGTGKSVVMRFFAEYPRELDFEWICRRAAPTATAASLIEGSTVASLFGLGRGRAYDDEDEADAIALERHRMDISDHLRGSLENVALCDIDEVSMVGHNTMKRIHDVLTAVHQQDDL